VLRGRRLAPTIRMKTSVVLVPLLILLCGVITYLVLPLEPRLRLMILLMDVFGAIAVGLLLWRQGQR